MLVSGLIPFSGIEVRRYAVFIMEDGKVRPEMVLSVDPLSSTPDMFVVDELYTQWSQKSPREYLQVVIADFLRTHPTFMEDFMRVSQ
jgi:hypothetical protein